MPADENVRTRIMDLVVAAKDQRLRPREVEKAVTLELRISKKRTRKILNELIEQGELVYTYRDPCSYVEFPCSGCQGGHRPARPMKVIKDKQGHRWICDADVNPDGDFRDQGCWNCGEVAFTRSG